MTDDRTNIAPEGTISQDDACAQLGLQLWQLRQLLDRKRLEYVVRREGLTNRRYITVASIAAYKENKA